ncbi:MAG: hypothetical protein HOP18_02325 [Deltaproteobacteria bacterium]|nr:hypothetical protein [Deltaproteobacteria bacterium]
MLLPNGERAIVDLRKLRDYCLNPDSPKGRHKARVFARALGITATEALLLRTKLLEAARTEAARRGELDLYGQRYTIDFNMETEVGKATVRSGWIVLHGKTAPQLTTCYVMKRNR